MGVCTQPSFRDARRPCISARPACNRRPAAGAVCTRPPGETPYARACGSGKPSCESPGASECGAICARARKLRRILKPLGTRMTASHYRKRGHMEFRQAAAYIQHRRRVGDFKQGARICRVGERHEMMVGCKRPFHRAHMDCIMTVVIARMQNCLRVLLAYCMRERGIGLPENLLRQ